MDPSKMDKRTKEYKDWAAKRAAEQTEQAAVAVATEDVEPLPEAPGSSPDVVVEEVKPEPKKPTRPWERTSSSRPWRRDYFNVKKKHAGFRCRFVDPENVESRLSRGYQVADPEHYGGLMDNDIRDTAGLGRAITRHGMVLMEIPEEGAQAYERQNEELIKSRYRSTRAELDREAASVGTKVTVKEEGLS